MASSPASDGGNVYTLPLISTLAFAAASTLLMSATNPGFAMALTLSMRIT